MALTRLLGVAAIFFAATTTRAHGPSDQASRPDVGVLMVAQAPASALPSLLAAQSPQIPGKNPPPAVPPAPPAKTPPAAETPPVPAKNPPPAVPPTPPAKTMPAAQNPPTPSKTMPQWAPPTPPAKTMPTAYPQLPGKSPAT
ncbi:MAG: hypothetical protein ACLP7Q_23170 [Isosphaeraceae bacterium]